MVYVILFQPFKTGSRSISIKNEQVPSQMVIDKKYCQTIKINLPTIATKLLMQILSKLKFSLSNKIAIGWLFQTKIGISNWYFFQAYCPYKIFHIWRKTSYLAVKNLTWLSFHLLNLTRFLRIFFEIHIGSVSIYTVSLLGYILSHIDKISTTVHNRICSISYHDSYATYTVIHFHFLKSLRRFW